MLTAVAIGWRFGMVFDMKCHDMGSADLEILRSKDLKT